MHIVRKRIFFLPAIVFSIFLFSSVGSCKNKSATVKGIPDNQTAKPDSTLEQVDSAQPGIKNDAAAILKTKQIPILCYHQIRDWRPTDSKMAMAYIVPVNAFSQQIKMLADSGYHTILPDQLYNYLTNGSPLPAKPVMLTFDDTDLDQFTIGEPELKKYGFKGVFFIMTVSLGRPHYMSKEQVKTLSDEGHVIGSHTWDHHNVKKYAGNDWVTQIDKPTKQLEAITGKPVNYFAYPFGLWNKEAIPELKKRGFKAAFQLYAKRDEQDPLFTIQRIIVPGSWTPAQLNKAIKNSF
ncbi:MAG: polysaccharide deacetylase [Chitinophagaceae bacterium]|nr:polysaccharide deacetylase [Chitinophagaceae bacterium]